MTTSAKQSPIFITGIERSGSSIVAKIIKTCGAFAGDVTEMSENIGIKKLMDAYYVDTLHLPASGQFLLQNTKLLTMPVNFEGQVEEILQKQGYKEQAPWMYKSSRIFQTWPIWHGLYPDAKWVIVRRRTGDIIQSCLKTGFMRAHHDQIGWLSWIKEQEKILIAMIDAGVDHKVVWPERMVYEDFDQICETLEWLGLEWNETVVNLVYSLLKNSPQKERSV